MTVPSGAISTTFFVSTVSVAAATSAVISASAGGVTASANLRINAAPIGAPTSLTASPADQQVTLDWQYDPGTQTYNVYRSLVSGGPYTKINSTPITSQSYTDTGLNDGTSYYYVVTAVSGGMESVYSNEANAAPYGIAPGDLVSYATSGSKITLYWTQVPHALGYNVYRGASSGYENYATPLNGTTLVNTASYSGSSMDTYTDTGLTAGTTYYYVVKAVYAAGWSEASNEDYDVPDAYAVPWDSGSPSAINTAVRNQFISDEPSISNLRVIGPDGMIYDDAFGSPLPPVGTFSPDTNQLTLSDGSVTTFPDESSEWEDYYLAPPGLHTPAVTTSGMPMAPSNGPFRRIVSNTGFRGVQGRIKLPSTITTINSIKGDTANIYFGQRAYGTGQEVDAGFQSNAGSSTVPAGWGLVLRIQPDYYVSNPSYSHQQKALYDVDNGHRFPNNSRVTLRYHAYGTTPTTGTTRMILIVADGMPDGNGYAAKGGPMKSHNPSYNNIQMKRLVAMAQSRKRVGVTLTGSSVVVPVWDQIQLEQASGSYTNWTTAQTARTSTGAFIDGCYDGGGFADVFWTPSSSSLYTDETDITVNVH